MSLSKIQLSALTDSTIYENSSELVTATNVNILIKDIIDSMALEAELTGGTSSSYVPLSGGTMTGALNTPQLSATTLIGGTILSGGTNLYSIFATPSSIIPTNVQTGRNIFTAGTASNPIINLANSPSVNNFSFSGTSTGNSLTATTISGGTFYSGSTNLYNIFATPSSIIPTYVQPGTNIITGGTSSNPTVNLVSSPSINNLTLSGTGNANSFSATTLSGGTIYSGNTNLYSIFATPSSIIPTYVQPGTNITTGGTSSNPTVNLVSSPSINNLTLSGTGNANSFSATTLSGGTIFSGSTPLQTILNNLSTGLVISSTTITSGNNGAVLFQSGSTLYEDKNNLFFDSINKNLAVGANSFDGTNPEKLKLSASSSSSSVNLLYGYSNINSYSQIAVKNSSTGTSASGDFVITADNGNESDGYFDMGMNGSQFAGLSWGYQNDAYLYVTKTGATGGNLYLGTNTGGKAIYFYTSGATSTLSQRMAITDNGVIATNMSATTLSATTLSAATYYSGSTPLATIINNIASQYSGSTYGTNYGGTVFVSVSGNNSTAVKYNITLPYQTIRAALSAATTGDTIYVFPGTYTEAGLFKDGVNYYFLNGATISPSSTYSATSIFQVINPTTDFAVDGFLTVNSAQNACAFDIQSNNNNVNYSFRFKSITMTNVTGFDTIGSAGNVARNAIRFATSQGNANVFGDIKITSTLSTQNSGGLSFGSDGVNLYYNGNITMTSTSNAFYSSTSSSPSRTLIGNFSSAGASGTIYIADRAYTNITGNISNSSYASGVYAYYSNVVYLGGVNFNGNIEGNVWLQGNTNNSQNLIGSINAAINNAGYIRLSSGNNNLDVSVANGGFYIDGGVNTINGNIVWASNGNIANIGALNVTNGTTFFKANSTTSFGRNYYPNTITGGKFYVCKGSYLFLTSQNGSGNDFNYGMNVNGGTVIVEGTVDYSTTTANGTGLYPIQYTSGSLVLDGARIINRQTGATASSIYATAPVTQNIKIYNNTYTNLAPSGGTLVNTVAGGGALMVYSGTLE